MTEKYLEKLADDLAHDLGRLANDPGNAPLGISAANNMRRLANYLEGATPEHRETAARQILRFCELAERAWI